MDIFEEYETHMTSVCQLEKNQLELLYSPSAWNQRMSRDAVIPEHISRTTKGTLKAKATLTTQLGIKYGSSSDAQTIDIYSSHSTPTDAPIFVFLHGGYWQALSIECSGFMSIPLVEAGAKVIAVGYDLAPAVSVDEIVSQTRAAIIHVVRMAKENNSRGVYLGGHSAGAHLVARALDENLKERLTSEVSNEAADLIKGAFLVSGVYDLRPLVLTSENDVLRMTTDSAWSLSPVNPLNLRQLTNHWSHVRLVIAVGEHDSPEFRKQSEHYNKALSHTAMSTKYTDVHDVDHFNVMENLEEPDFILTKELLELMKLNDGDTTINSHQGIHHKDNTSQL